MNDSSRRQFLYHAGLFASSAIVLRYAPAGLVATPTYAKMQQAAALAHTNTRKRLTESHDFLGMHFDPAPAEALPTDTFTDKRSLTVNGEVVAVSYVPPAHTDADVFVHYTKANVLHMGDVFFNGMYP